MKCARTACQAPLADDFAFYNQSTHQLYCAKCAIRLNRENEADAKRLYGGPLCVPMRCEEVVVDDVAHIVQDYDTRETQDIRNLLSKYITSIKPHPIVGPGDDPAVSWGDLQDIVLD